jgi:beta-xylosidase
MKFKNTAILFYHLLFLLVFMSPGQNLFAQKTGNPVFDGWYADPEGVVFGNEFWIYPTTSDDYEKQVYFDAFSSKDLVTWEKHSRVLDTASVSWAWQAMWAPSVVEKEGKYYFFFGANDIQRKGSVYWDEKNKINHTGGIGVAVADSPAGPFKDYLGKPLIDDFHNDAQPIDQFVCKDSDNQYYMFYGGWGKCNLVKLNDDFTGFIPWEDSTIYKDITPENYVEGPMLFQRNGKYYFMWSEGGWTNGTYKVAYAIADKITGPFQRIGTILESDEKVATGAGHNSVMNIPGTDNWLIVYHRRPIPNEDRDHRVTCIDKLEFNDDGTIKPVIMTFEGVSLK